MTKKLLWVGEVARELGVCARTVSRWADAGLVDVIRDVKGRRHFKPEAIQILRKRLGLGEVCEGEGSDYTPNAI
jgi:DNA-binding transcriptional MerR regulator